MGGPHGNKEWIRNHEPFAFGGNRVCAFLFLPIRAARSENTPFCRPPNSEFRPRKIMMLQRGSYSTFLL